MNQELKQRLIAAVVVTALAAIFIPMLFDDPVDNSGQLVSELVIPTTSVKTGEESALETGVVDQTNKPVKTKNTIQEAEPSKQKSTPKPHLEADTVVAVPKKPAKKTERSTTTQAKKVTKPQPKEATAKVIKPQPKEATAKATKLSVDEKITTPDKNNSVTQYYRYPTTPN
jgi:DedD protein